MFIVMHYNKYMFIIKKTKNWHDKINVHESILESTNK